MSVTLNPTITFNGKEAREGILERMFNKPAFTRYHTIYSNIVAKEQIAFLQRFSKLTKLEAGCGTGMTSKEIPMHEKFWEPVNTKIWLQLCWRDFIASFFVYGQKKGIDRNDLSGTDLMEYLMEVIPDAGLDDLWRIVWFGDEDISDYAGSPQGTLGDATDIPYYNLIDGLWKQIFAGVAIGAGTWGHIPHYAISENSGGTYTLQELAAAKSLTIFKQLLYQADDRLRDASNKVILCTRSIMDNWNEYKESKTLESSFKREDTYFTEGVFRGIPIYEVPVWDRLIQTDFDNGTTLYLPHRAIMTTVDQIAVGFDGFDKVDAFKAYLDDTTELYNIKGGYKVDAKILENYMFSVAY